MCQVLPTLLPFRKFYDHLVVTPSPYKDESCKEVVNSKLMTRKIKYTVLISKKNELSLRAEKSGIEKEFNNNAMTLRSKYVFYQLYHNV